LVVHGKSEVQRFDLPAASEDSLKAVLRQHFGEDVETKMKLHMFGAEMHSDDTASYKKTPVVAICTNRRHVPMHAKAQEEDAAARTSRSLDLHTSEAPIHPACMDATLEAACLLDLAVGGVADISAVYRLAVKGPSLVTIGKTGIYRARAHWQPPVPQSDRGTALMLSSLYVFAATVQEMSDDRASDSVLHVFDLLTRFPPALRALYLLVQGKTPTPAESAALSHAVFETLDFVPASIVGTDRTRIFEGSRLPSGYILEKARTLKLPGDTKHLPYITAFSTLDLRDHFTTEPVMFATQTRHGLLERAFWEASGQDAVLANSSLPGFASAGEVDKKLARVALLTGGASAETIAFLPLIFPRNTSTLMAARSMRPWT